MFTTRTQTIVINSQFGRATLTYVAPTQPSDCPVTYFHGGYGVDHIGYVRYIAKKHGRAVFTITYDQPRARDRVYWVLSNEGVPAEQVHRRMVRRMDTLQPIVAEGQMLLAQDILIAIAKLGLSQIDAIGQSAGAMRVLELVRQASRVVRHIVLPYPAGLFKVDRSQLVHRALSLARNSARSRRVPYEPSIFEVIEAADQHRQSKDMLATGENILLSNHGMPDAVWRAKSAPHIGVIAGLQDDLFLPQRVLAHLHPTTSVVHIVPGLHGFRGRQSIVDLTVDTLTALSQSPAHSLQLHLPQGISKAEAYRLEGLVQEVRNRASPLSREL